MTRPSWQPRSAAKAVGGSRRLEDGSRVAVLGGGPAGSFFASFLLDFADMTGLRLEVDIFEPRDFHVAGPKACNMCGGIISETLVQNLAVDGISLPESVVQRGIDSYVLHMDRQRVSIDTPLHEKRIGTVHRGAGPRDLETPVWESFDGYLQNQAVERGARVRQERVTAVERDGHRLKLATRSSSPDPYDLLVVATGVNSTSLRLLEGLDIGYQPPTSVKTFIREYHLGADVIEEHLGSSMHVFLLDLPGLEFAAFIPKGEYVTLCLLGDKIDKQLLATLLAAPEVRSCMPPGWNSEDYSCQCSPSMAVKGARLGHGDAIIFIGDCGVSRLYKDGIGAAYRTAKAAARTAVFHGISAADIERHYYPLCRSIEGDNHVGKFIFGVTSFIQRSRLARATVLRLVRWEQSRSRGPRRLSTVLWDMFTGSATYREIFLRTLHPAFIGRLAATGIRAIPDSLRPTLHGDPAPREIVGSSQEK